MNTYDALDDLASSADRAGVTTTYTYSSTGNLLSESTRGCKVRQRRPPQTTTYGYTDSYPGDLTTVTEPRAATCGITPTTRMGTFTPSVTAPPTPENANGDETLYGYNTATDG